MKSKYSIALLLFFVCSVFFVSAQEQNKTTSATSGVQSEQNPSQKAQNNNTVRSNRTEIKIATDQSGAQDVNNASSSKKGYDYYKAKSDLNSNSNQNKAQDHNSSRSNKTASKVDNGDGSDNGAEKNNPTDKKTDTSETARTKRK